MFVYSPYLKKEHFIICTGEENRTVIEEGMTKLCGEEVPAGMSVEEIKMYINDVQNKRANDAMYLPPIYENGQ
jgi:hypothetical protein